MRLRVSALFLLCTLPCRFVASQATAMQSFQDKIMAAFSPGGNLPTSLALSGSADWTAGSLHDSGTVQLQATSDGTTTENWSLSQIPHSVKQGPVDFLNFDRQCTNTSQDGADRVVSGPNCLRGVPWFFPSFVFEASYAGSTSVTDQTNQGDTALGLVELKYMLTFPDTTGLKKAALDSLASVAKTTAVTVFYNANTGLPALLVYQEAYDGDDSQFIEISVQYSDYGLESGFMIPHRIRRYVQRTLQVDFNVTNVIAK